MEIDDELEPLTVYNCEVSPSMYNLLKHVLKAIPNEYTEDFPSFSVFETHSPWGAHVESDGEGEGSIFCDPRLLNSPTDVAIGTLAHEFTHLFLGHSGKGGLQDEYEADELACRWGFSAEVEAMRQHLGPPADQQI